MHYRNKKIPIRLVGRDAWGEWGDGRGWIGGSGRPAASSLSQCNYEINGARSFACSVSFTEPANHAVFLLRSITRDVRSLRDRVGRWNALKRLREHLFYSCTLTYCAPPPPVAEWGFGGGIFRAANCHSVTKRERILEVSYFLYLP